jgi:hypothetical protein
MLQVPAQQLISGKVVSSQTGESISGVAVYLSGTSIGVISGVDGNYEISYPENLNVPIVFRMMGFETLQFPEPLNTDLSFIRMVEKPDELDTVYIVEDTWSRDKKERYFKKFFLGKVPAAKQCEVLNLDKVRLRFNKITNELTAYSNEPVMVRNTILGYDIQVDISEFEIVFDPIILSGSVIIRGNSGIEKPTHYPKSSYMAVSMFFKEMESKRPSIRRRLRNRKRLYAVSELKLFRSLRDNTMKEDGYMLVHDRKKVEFKDHIRSRATGDVHQVSFRELAYTLMDKSNNQTDIYIDAYRKIIIDKYGNCLTGRNITFGGFLGSLHLSGMLPLDYIPK